MVSRIETKVGIRVTPHGGLDNVFIERLWRSLKYEQVYLAECTTGSEARACIGWWVDFYNTRRPHSSLGDDQTPEDFPHYALLHTSRQGLWDLSAWGGCPGRLLITHPVLIEEPKHLVQPFPAPPCDTGANRNGPVNTGYGPPHGELTVS